MGRHRIVSSETRNSPEPPQADENSEATSISTNATILSTDLVFHLITLAQNSHHLPPNFFLSALRPLPLALSAAPPSIDLVAQKPPTFATRRSRFHLLTTLVATNSHPIPSHHHPYTYEVSPATIVALPGSTNLT